MKIADLKHNHSLTDLLKVLLFSILMLAPIISVGVRSAYVIVNKNAYQSYSGKPLEYETTQLTSVDEMNLLDTYMFSNVGSYSSSVDTNYIGYTDISNIETNNTTLKTSLENGSYFRFTYSSNNKTVYVYDENLSILRNETMNQQTITFNFVLTSYQINSLTNVSMFYTFEVANNSYLDNVFNYSVEKLANDQMFKWTENTPVYTGINAMCTQLGITAPAIPIIIAYWLILTCVYIVIDILIKLFTYITHLIGNKSA